MLINDTWLKFIPCLTTVKQKPTVSLSGLHPHRLGSARVWGGFAKGRATDFIQYQLPGVIIWRAGTLRDILRLPAQPSHHHRGCQYCHLGAGEGQWRRHLGSGQLFLTCNTGYGSKAGTLDHLVPPTVQGGGTIILPKNNVKKELAAVSCSLIIDTFKKHHRCQALFSGWDFQRAINTMSDLSWPLQGGEPGREQLGFPPAYSMRHLLRCGWLKPCSHVWAIVSSRLPVGLHSILHPAEHSSPLALKIRPFNKQLSSIPKSSLSGTCFSGSSIYRGTVMSAGVMSYFPPLFNPQCHHLKMEKEEEL